MGLVGVGIGVAGALFGGIAKASADNYQAQVARNNAVTEKQNAAYAASAGAAQTEQSGLVERGKLAQLRAGIAANGLDVNSGTASDLQVSQRELGNLDTRTVSNNAALQTYGYETKATGYEAEAALKKSEGVTDLISGGLGAAGKIAGSPAAVSALGFGPSQLSGNPTVGDNYQWMQGNGGAGPSDGGFVD